MTEHPTEPTKAIIDDMNDLELIVNYLNGHLDPERVEAVRRRLDEDAAFRELVAPLLLTWSVPDDLEEFPRPEGEAEREWEKFKRRPGFALARAAHEAEAARDAEAAPPRSRWQRVRHWRHWKGLRVLVLLLVGAYMIGAQMMYSALEDRVAAKPVREYSVVPHDTGWISLNDGIAVRLSPGASLQVDHRRLDGMKHVLLDGTARFRVAPLDSIAPFLRTRALHVETRAGSVWAGEADFRVEARGDTAQVFVHPLGPRRAVMSHLRTVSASGEFPGRSIHVSLFDLDGARLVRGRDPERITTPR